MNPERERRAQAAGGLPSSPCSAPQAPGRTSTDWSGWRYPADPKAVLDAWPPPPSRQALSHPAKPPRARGGGLPSPCPGLPPAAVVQRASSPGRSFLKHTGQNAAAQLYFLSFFKKQKYIFIVCGFSSIPPFSLTYNKIDTRIYGAGLKASSQGITER